MFIRDDIYTTSGSLKLFHCWTDKVTKFDSSAFYNWEQDNLPIYDLEERTFYLWEQLGYLTSSIPGVALVVSADASDSDITCNQNIFRSVSSAIQALPQLINFPILIEIANFGDMGSLELNNFKFGPRGSLEIINRNYASQEYGFSGANGALYPQLSGSIYGGTNPWKYVSSVNLVGAAALPTSRTSPLQGFLEASCLSISSTVFSSTYDARLSGTGSSDRKLNAYLSFIKSSSNYNKPTLVIDSKNTYQPFGADEYTLNFMPYVMNPDANASINTKDASSYDFFETNIVSATNSVTYNPSSAINGLFFGNKLSKIYVNNCDGPIFIRNFFVDGSGPTNSSSKYGVEVNNSPNIYLENIVATRFRKAGFYFNNSTVNILRSCVANRIYDFDESDNRLTGDYEARRTFISYDNVNEYLRDDTAAGLLANNSQINLSSTKDLEFNLYASEVNDSSYSAFPAAFHILEFNENANGIVLNNSNLFGGDSASYSDSYKMFNQSILDCNNNVNCGFNAFNSKISLNGKLRLLDNFIGSKIVNSNFDFEEIECQRNQIVGLQLDNSKSIYNKNLLRFQDGSRNLTPGDGGTYGSYPFKFNLNGRNLVLQNSEMGPGITSSMDEKYYICDFDNPIGILSTDSIPESILVKDNSNLTLISADIRRDSNHSLNSSVSKKGSEINCVNNSKVSLKGTGLFPTRISGPDLADFHHKYAGVAANQNSVIEINGPTIIAQFGIDLLADKNSTINITPAKSYLDHTIDFSSIDLTDPTNHTMVELHSTRACIVVDNQSTLNAKDLGSYRRTWDVTSFASNGLDYGGPTQYYETYVSAGSLQFYPNPINISLDQAESVSINNNFTNYNFAYGALQNLTDSPLEFSNVTYGGMCVRALNNSVVNVNNVNFPCGWWNPSAPYYDGEITFDEGGACNRLFIWNIADNSQLKCSYASVSGLYPGLAGYVGPSGVWSNAGVVYSGLPAGTPDTSTLSVLDIYGANPAGTAFTQAVATNSGPFRLFFSVNPFVNTLIHSNSLEGYQIIPQIYSQGYQPSTTLLCSGSASSLYRMSLLRNSTGDVVPSGFYYGSGVTDNDGYLKVMLDESFANTFANAKHCASGKSGNSKLVSILYAYNVDLRGDSTSNLGVGSVNLFDIERDN